jgi:hypothetical protein
MAGIALTLLLLAAVAGYALRLARPASEAVRLRNAWRLQPSERSDFAWIPPQFPPGFNVERRPATEEFRAIVATVGVGAIDGDWNKALALAQHLTERAEDKGAIQADPSTSYRLIRRGYGYCADFVKVFLALAHASGLCARQWGFSFDGFGGHGHTIVELFDRQRGRWVMVDVYNNFHFVDAETGEPMGALELREALQGRGPAAALRANGRGRPGFVHEHKALDYYRRGLDQWYLMWGNAVFSYYAHPLVRALGRVSRVLAHAAANLVGIQPGIRIYPSPENVALVRRMFALRRRLWVIAGAFSLLLVALVVQLALMAGLARSAR